MSGKMQYKVLADIRHNGKSYTPGKKPISLDEDAAAPLIAVKAIDPNPITKASSNPGNPTPLEYMTALIKEGITHPPTVDVVKKACGVTQLSAKSRDEIWTAALAAAENKTD